MKGLKATSTCNESDLLRCTFSESMDRERMRERESSIRVIGDKRVRYIQIQFRYTNRNGVIDENHSHLKSSRKRNELRSIKIRTKKNGM